MPRSKPNTKKSSPAKPGAPSEAAKAFALVEPELDDVREVVPINVDIPRAVSVAIAAVPHLQALRPRFVEELPKHPLSQLDKLQTYALAAWYAHLLALPTSAGPDALKRLLDEAAPLREDLLVAAEALAHKGIVDAQPRGVVPALERGRRRGDRAVAVRAGRRAQAGGGEEQRGRR